MTTMPIVGAASTITPVSTYRSPTTAQWTDLYEAAVSFRDLMPWRWMEDLDVFGVTDPRSGETGYCTVLGGGGEEFGLGIFMGAAGFAHWADLVNSAADPEDYEAVSSLRMLSFTLVDRGSMPAHDLAVIRSLGMKFRGSTSWPLFLSHMPGYVAWQPGADQAEFLTDAIRQAIAVSLAVRDDGLDLQAPASVPSIYIRNRREGKWQLERQALPPRPARAKGPLPPDQPRLAELRDDAKRVAEGWEVDIFRTSSGVRAGKGQPPFLPVCMVVAGGPHSLVLGIDLLGPQPSLQELQDAFLGMLEKAGRLPESLVVGTESMHQVVKAVAAGLNIGLRIGELPVIDEFRAGFGAML